MRQTPSRELTESEKQAYRDQNRAKSREQRLDKCRHFTGFANPTCKAGVRYDNLKTQEGPFIKTGPCFKRNGTSERCPHASFKSLEEVEAELDRFDVRLQHSIEAFQRITEHSQGRRGVSGRITCPACNGALAYSIASLNGRCHARCSTPGCLVWME